MVMSTKHADQVATIAGLFVALASLLVALADFLRDADTSPDPANLAQDLALKLREQWLDEAQARRLRDPRILPLAWATSARSAADTLRTGPDGSRVLRLRLDGRLEGGRFEEVIRRLAQGFDQDSGAWRYRPPHYAKPERLLPSPTRYGQDDEGVEVGTFDRGGSALVADRRDDCLAMFGGGRTEIWRPHGDGWAPRPWSLTPMCAGAFHPRKPLLAMADVESGDIHLLPTPAASSHPDSKRTLTGHSAPVTSIDFSQDGHWLATGDEEGVIRMWNAKSL